MKQVPAGLADELYLQSDHRPADLVQIELAAGTIRWTSADVAITFGGFTWIPGPILDEIQVRSSLSLEVDSASVRIAPGDLALAGVGLLRRAIRGDFRGARLLVQRAFITAAGAVAGLDTMFDGAIVDTEPSSIELRLNAKSAIDRVASAVLPSRAIQPGCPYQVYSAQCGAVQATFTATTTVAAGSTTEVINLAAATTLAVVSGWIEFTSGALTGQRATIVQVLSTSQVRVAVTLDSVPAVGDGVKVIRGCDKTRGTCSSVFANLPNFGGCPDVPPKEST